MLVPPSNGALGYAKSACWIVGVSDRGTEHCEVRTPGGLFDDRTFGRRDSAQLLERPVDHRLRAFRAKPHRHVSRGNHIGEEARDHAVLGAAGNRLSCERVEWAGEHRVFSHVELAARDRPGRDLSARSHAELVADVFDVRLNGPIRDHQPIGDVAVGQPFRDECRNLALTLR